MYFLFQIADNDVFPSVAPGILIEGDQQQKVPLGSNKNLQEPNEPNKSGTNKSAKQEDRHVAWSGEQTIDNNNAGGGKKDNQTVTNNKTEKKVVEVAMTNGTNSDGNHVDSKNQETMFVGKNSDPSTNASSKQQTSKSGKYALLSVEFSIQPTTQGVKIILYLNTCNHRTGSLACVTDM